MVLWGVICVTGNNNVKEACEALMWDIVNMGLQVRWKDHQSAESRTRVLLMNVPLVLDRGGSEGEIIRHLTEIEKGLLKKGVLPSEYIGIHLPEINVTCQQNKQGKGKNKVEKDLSLNKLTTFQETECLVCTVEAAEGSWPRLGPLWEAFHKMGLCWWALGCSCLMVVMYNGRATDSDCITMQQLRRVNVIHTYMMSCTVLPNIATVHKRVKIEMEDKSRPPHRFTDLCREFMWLKLPYEGETSKFLFNAIIPIVSGHQQGCVIDTYCTDNKGGGSHGQENQMQNCCMVFWILAKCYGIQACGGAETDRKF
jgi:hypothetical protein